VGTQEGEVSVDLYICCHNCKTKLWIAQDGLSGFTFYRGDEPVMKALGKFFEDHSLGDTANHRMGLINEDQHDDYTEVKP
jgi:hypothetical protein